MKSQPKWTLVSSGGDCEALYKDGVLRWQGHPPDMIEVFNLLDVPISYIHPDPSMEGRFPTLLSDVVQYDHKAAEQREREALIKKELEILEKEVKEKSDRIAALRKL